MKSINPVVTITIFLMLFVGIGSTYAQAIDSCTFDAGSYYIYMAQNKNSSRELGISTVIQQFPVGVNWGVTNRGGFINRDEASCVPVGGNNDADSVLVGSGKGSGVEGPGGGIGRGGGRPCSHVSLDIEGITFEDTFTYKLTTPSGFEQKGEYAWSVIPSDADLLDYGLISDQMVIIDWAENSFVEPLSSEMLFNAGIYEPFFEAFNEDDERIGELTLTQREILAELPPEAFGQLSVEALDLPPVDELLLPTPLDEPIRPETLILGDDGTGENRGDPIGIVCKPALDDSAPLTDIDFSREIPWRLEIINSEDITIADFSFQLTDVGLSVLPSASANP